VRADPIAGSTAMVFLHDVGARLIKGERIAVVGPLPDGSGELTVRYARFGDMLAVLEALDTTRAMGPRGPGGAIIKTSEEALIDNYSATTKRA
jgi:hypothetical protein